MGHKKSIGRKAVSCLALSLFMGAFIGTNALADTSVLPTKPTEEKGQEAETEAVVYEGHSYAVCDEAMSWDDAKAACEMRGGHLVVINDEKEQQFLQTIVIGGKKPYYWIGLSDSETEGTFKWVNGDSLTYTNWGEGQPDNWQDSEDVVMLPNRDMQYKDWSNAFGTWNDMNGEGDVDHSLVQMGFLCEWDYIDSDRAEALDNTFDRLEARLREEGINVDIDRVNGTVTIDSAVLFDVGSYTVKEEGLQIIGKFVNALGSVLKEEEIRESIGSINIQGHTDSDGTYEQNVTLSERRAESVRSACLDSADDSSTQKALRELIKVSGCASDYPVLDANGNEDKKASRRVVFVFYMK